jgi:hypothetical protein
MAEVPPIADVHDVISGLARALDDDDFATARTFLAEDCVYEVGETTHRGPAAIVGSYAAASARAHRLFDEVRYESEVGPVTGAAATVTFTDYLFKAGHPWHRYRLQQTFTVDATGRIARIVHEEIPGERARLDDYFKACGIAR